MRKFKVPTNWQITWNRICQDKTRANYDYVPFWALDFTKSVKMSRCHANLLGWKIQKLPGVKAVYRIQNLDKSNEIYIFDKNGIIKAVHYGTMWSFSNFLNHWSWQENTSNTNTKSKNKYSRKENGLPISVFI